MPWLWLASENLLIIAFYIELTFLVRGYGKPVAYHLVISSLYVIAIILMLLWLVGSSIHFIDSGAAACVVVGLLTVIHGIDIASRRR